MTKLTIVTALVWLTGVSSAAALVTTLARPPVPAEAPKAEVAPPPAPEPPLNLENVKVPRPLVIPPAVRTQVRFTRTTKHALRCGDYKPLQIGPVDRGVRYCQ